MSDAIPIRTAIRGARKNTPCHSTLERQFAEQREMNDAAPRRIGNQRSDGNEHCDVTSERHFAARL